jgi:hypothetical protein
MRRARLFRESQLQSPLFSSSYRESHDELNRPYRQRAADISPSPGGEGGRSTLRSSRREEALTEFPNDQWPMSLSLLTSAATGEAK